MILVTGATGMIGRAVVYRLLNHGASVRAHGRSISALEKLFSGYVDPSAQEDSVTPNYRCPPQTRGTNQTFEAVVGDLSTMTLAEAQSLCDGCLTIVHIAALAHRREADKSLYEKYNIRATELLGLAAQKSGVERFIFLS